MSEGNGRAVQPGLSPGEKSTESINRSPDSGQWIGDYRLVRKIGEGGMGVVYEAEQQHPRRPVALKVIRGGRYVDEHVVKLFEREAQALARLKHPGIAAIYEAGHTEDGQHFFAMELVRGVPLLDYALSRRHEVPPEASELKERLRLFCKICEAVNYAHQRGVIHRDLKPSNILVSSGEGMRGSGSSLEVVPEVKILDFGLARITDADVAVSTIITEVGQIQGTLAYMSPEQTHGNPDEIDLRSDVYTLGVILYEMLTGQLPYEVHKGMPHEALRVICEEAPQPPSRLGFLTREQGREKIDRDLDTILLKVLEKEPWRRYQSALALAEDVERYLNDQPILAHPPSTIYQIRKLVARHKAVVGFVVTLALLVTGFGIAMAVLSARIARERDKAIVAERTARQVSSFLVDLFKISDPSEARGNTVKAREILDQGAERISGELKEQPVVQATLMDTMGRVYQSLGIYGKAQPLLEGALKTRQQKYGNAHPEVAESLNNLGALLQAKGEYARAEQMFNDSLAIRRKLLGEEAPAIAESLNNLGGVHYFTGDYTGADPLYRQSLAMYRKLLGNESLEVAGVLNNLAMNLKALGDYETLEPLYRESLEIRREVLGNVHPAISQSLNNLAMFLYRKGEYDRAEPLFREALALNRKLYGEEHPEVATSLNNLALLLRDKGDYAAAEPLFRETLALHRKQLGEESEGTIGAMNSLAHLLTKKGDTRAAESMFREALSLQQQKFPESHWEIATTKSLLGACLTAQERYREAEVLLLEAYPIIREKFGDKHDRTKVALKRVVDLYTSWGKPERAATYSVLLPQQ